MSRSWSHQSGNTTDIVGSLLAAKLTPPTDTPTAQVIRKTILETLFAKPEVRLVLVRAPAGFGKTTALVQVHSEYTRKGIETAWLTLDRADNDPSRFLNCLAAAISHMTDADTLAPPVAAPSGSLGDIALSIMGVLSGLSSPFALFLDDFELLSDPTVLRLMREILENMPHNGKLFIGSRGLPDLRLGRLRAHGKLLEISAEQMRFSVGETAEFFEKCRHMALPDEQISALHNKTEGWIAGLSLASLALEGCEDKPAFIQHFSGSDDTVTDYLANDVLSRQPEHVRDFLLRTCILRHLHIPLCNTLVPGTDSAAILAQLENTNLFLIPLDTVEKTYRYHHLFAEFLRRELDSTMPDEALRLHASASAWYEAQNRIVPAIDHALEGRAYPRAIALLSQHAELLLEEGRMRLLTRWLDSLGPDLLAGSALLQVIHIWAVCFTRGAWEAMALLETSACAKSPDPVVQAHVLALRPMLLAMMDRNAEAYEIGMQAMAASPVSRPFPDSVLASEMAYLTAIMGHYHQSAALLDDARFNQGGNASTFIKMYSESIEGIINLEAGQLRQAMARFKIAVGATHSANYSHSNGNAWAGILYAASLYEINDLQQAERLIHVYLPLATDAGLADHMIIGYGALARIAYLNGDVDQSFYLLTELEHLGHQRRLPRLVASARLIRGKILLAQGNLRAAEESLQRARIPGVWEQIKDLRLPAHDIEYLDLGLLLWRIASGDAPDALREIDQEIARATEQDRYRRGLKLQLIRCIALYDAGDDLAAMSEFDSLMKTTCREGFIRLIVDEGLKAGLLVQRFMNESDTIRSRNDPILSEYLQRLLAAFGETILSDTDITTDALDATLLQPLSGREISLLKLLAEGYSNRALSEKLFISESTVRTHLRNINGKLNARNRTQAVAIARRLSIIE